jgi:hypothetical protein
MYGWSVLHCLPATVAEHPVEANGTVLRAPTVARWAAAAASTWRPSPVPRSMVAAAYRAARSAS